MVNASLNVLVNDGFTRAYGRVHWFLVNLDTAREAASVCVIWKELF